MASYGNGPQGGKSLYSPSYNVQKYTKIYTDSDLNNQVQLKRVIGPQRIIFKYTAPAIGDVPQTNSYTWSFAIEGGNNRPTPQLTQLSFDYNVANNFAVKDDDVPPVGCSVQTVENTTNTNRINIFDVSETVTSNSLVLRMALCPFTNIPTTIDLISGTMDANSTLEISIVYFRSIPGERNGGWSIGYMSPSYTTIARSTSILSTNGTNPLDDGSLAAFTRFNGQQTIHVTNTTSGYSFLFDVSYGIIDGGYLGYIDPTANAILASGNRPPEGCTVSSVAVSGGNTNSIPKMIRLIATTYAADQNRDYIFDIYPSGYKNIPPTISLSGAPLGGESLEVTVYQRYFNNI
jgi:hypothetical protein